MFAKYDFNMACKTYSVYIIEAVINITLLFKLVLRYGGF